MRFAEDIKEGTECAIRSYFIIFRVKLIILYIDTENEKLYTVRINNELIHGTLQKILFIIIIQLLYRDTLSTAKL